MQRPSLGWTTTLDIVQQQQRQSTLDISRGIKRSHTELDATTSSSNCFKNDKNPTETANSVKWQSIESNEDHRIVASEIVNINESDHERFGAKSLTVPIPTPSQNPLLSLSHLRYGLPATLVENLQALGINSIYPWQSSCLLGRGLLNHQKNLVYTAPTGGGKSLVADILMLKRVIDDPSKKAVLVLPYVALVQEKLKWLRKVVEGVHKHVNASAQTDTAMSHWRKPCDNSVRVAGFFGGSGT